MAAETTKRSRCGWRRSASSSHGRLTVPAGPPAQVYARTLIELISQRQSVPLLLSISIREHSADMFRGVLKELDARKVW